MFKIGLKIATCLSCNYSDGYQFLGIGIGIGMLYF